MVKVFYIVGFIIIVVTIIYIMVKNDFKKNLDFNITDVKVKNGLFNVIFCIENKTVFKNIKIDNVRVNVNDKLGNNYVELNKQSLTLLAGKNENIIFTTGIKSINFLELLKNNFVIVVKFTKFGFQFSLSFDKTDFENN